MRLEFLDDILIEILFQSEIHRSNFVIRSAQSKSEGTNLRQRRRLLSHLHDRVP